MTRALATLALALTLAGCATLAGVSVPNTYHPRLADGVRAVMEGQ